MSEQNEISESQLRWRCRRGMLELDLLLTTFVEREYNTLSEESAALFSTLLDYQDQALFDLLLEKKRSQDAAISALVARIRKVSCNEFNRVETING